MKRRYCLIGVIVIFCIIIGYLWFSNSRKLSYEEMLNYEIPVCNETIRSICKYDDVLIISNMDLLLMIKDNIPSGSTFINWWDYGKELEYVANVNPVIKSPSKSLEISTACYNAKMAGKNIECEDIDFESEEKVNDVANFFITSNQTEALCIAKKYNSNYFFVTRQEIGLFYWIYYASNHLSSPNDRLLFTIIGRTSSNPDRYGNIIINEDGLRATITDSVNFVPIRRIIYHDGDDVKESLDNSTHAINDLIWVSPDSKYLIYANEKIVDSVIVKALLDSKSLVNFKEIYNNGWAKIFELNLNNITC